MDIHILICPHFKVHHSSSNKVAAKHSSCQNVFQFGAFISFFLALQCALNAEYTPHQCIFCAYCFDSDVVGMQTA